MFGVFFVFFCIVFFNLKLSKFCAVSKLVMGGKVERKTKMVLVHFNLFMSHFILVCFSELQ